MMDVKQIRIWGQGAPWADLFLSKLFDLKGTILIWGIWGSRISWCNWYRQGLFMISKIIVFMIRFARKSILNSYCAHQLHGDYSRSPELQIKSSASETMKGNSQEGHHSLSSLYLCPGTGRVETHVCTEQKYLFACEDVHSKSGQ